MYCVPWPFFSALLEYALVTQFVWKFSTLTRCWTGHDWRNLLKCYFPTHSNYILHFMKSCPFIKSRSPGLALPWVSYLKSLKSLAHRGWGRVCLDGKAQQISDLKSPGWKHDPKNQQRGQFWWCRIGLVAIPVRRGRDQRWGLTWFSTGRSNGHISLGISPFQRRHIKGINCWTVRVLTVMALLQIFRDVYQWLQFQRCDQASFY